MSQKRLFGTDGIRGVAGESPLDETTVRRFGAALGRVLGRADAGCTVVVGRDTRESGVWLRDTMACGLESEGGRVVDAGLITTPGLALAVGDGDFDAGVMISASHNPFRDNGLKVFDRSGFKISDDLERQMESVILDDAPTVAPRDPDIEQQPQLVEHYRNGLEQRVPSGRFRGVRLVLDCANGSASELGPAVFRDLGADVTTLGCEPNGRNINLDCGSTHLDGLKRAVAEQDADLGIAFDGDADRALAVDRRGRVLDGDYILFLTARRMHREGRLRGDAVVATIMSNLWLEKRLDELGIRLLRAPVGDKYVLEQMLESDLVLGGEQSGHVIYREFATTGDGILTGLLTLDTILDEEEKLEAMLDGIRPCPQVIVNVKVRDKPDLRAHPSIGPEVGRIEQSLADAGRVVLRYSGTEPLARVMVEGDDDATVRRSAEELADVIRRELGS